MNYTISEENYLKAIYHLQTEHNNVTTNTLAEKLQTKPSSVTDMTKKLSSKKLLHYRPYYGFSLSAEGKRIALTIIRRHRLWEFFLSEKLKFGWDEVHSLAEELEHVSSSDLVDRLDEFLGHPQFDPHGDPIPDNKGEIRNIHKIAVSLLPLNHPAEVVQVTHQSPEMLELLQHKNIRIGIRLEVKKHFEYDHTLELKIRNTLVTISETLAKNIMVAYGHSS